MTLDTGRLDASGEGYGAELTRQVFAEAALVRYFREVFRTTQAAGGCLRVRLNLWRGAEPLHNLKWDAPGVALR